MSAQVVHPTTNLTAELTVPGDKSIAHRALILAALATGTSRLEGVPEGEDVGATIGCLLRLGCDVDGSAARRQVRGRGIAAWRSPSEELDCRNSGTTMRVLAGALAASHASATLTGDASLSRRPMERVVEPLRKMGARITSRDGHAPLTVRGTELIGLEHHLQRPSAQVKTALLLAGLHASGPSSVREPYPTRDHTERLLVAMGARLAGNHGTIRIEPQQGPLTPLQLSIPGDFSSAAFFLGAAAMRKGWTVTVSGVGLNPSRTAFLEILKEMGSEVRTEPAGDPAIEPQGRVTVRGARLRAVHVGADRVAAAIDEIPILLVVASQAQGVTTVSGAGELRLKESDRLTTIATGLKQLGVRVEENPDGMMIEGPNAIQPAHVDSAGDHRVAMALAVAGLVADAPLTIEGASAVSVSYPGFFEDLQTAAHGRS